MLKSLVGASMHETTRRTLNSVLGLGLQSTPIIDAEPDGDEPEPEPNL